MAQSKAVYTLSAETIDIVAQSTYETLMATSISSREATRIRIAIEEVMLAWHSELGDVSCEFTIKKQFGRMLISLSAPGKQINPNTIQSGDFEEELAGNNLLGAIGISPAYRYRNGINYIVLSPETRKKNPVLRILSIIILSVLVGFLLKLLPESTRTFISESILEPFCSAFMRLLLTVACPMIFLSFVSGIVNIGDVSTFNKVGKSLIKGYASRLLLIGSALMLINLPFYPISSSSQATSADSLWGQIYNMFLNIVPSNMVEPFLNGNTLQIIFLAVLAGAAMLFLNKKIPMVIDFVDQLNSIFTFIMRGVTSIVEVFISATVIDLFLTDNSASLAQAPLLILAVSGGAIAVIFCSVLVVSLRYHIRIIDFLRKTFSTTLIALTTASSTAAFSNNAFDCEKNLGIDQRLVKFGVPLGLTTYKVGDLVVLIMESFFMASFYSVPITPNFIFTSLVASLLLTIASLPVVGGGLAVYSVLFLTLGIPAEAVGIAAALDVIFDYILTPTTTIMQQVRLTLAAGKLNMLDKSILLNKKVINQ